MTAGGRIQIRPVHSRAQLKSFIKLPFALYRGDQSWVPPLIVDRLAFFDVRRNPFYRTADVALWTAWRDGRMVGRIAACVNRDFNEFHHTQTGSFGFFESVDDPAVAFALFDTAAEWLRARDMTQLLGPFNFSTNHEVGFLAEGFDAPPVVMMTYNPPYYLKLAEAYGMARARDLLAFYKRAEDDVSERIRRIAERVRTRARVEIRPLDRSDFRAEIERVRTIYNQAWSANWGFVPLREEEFQHIARDMKMILDPHMAFVAEIDGRPVGFCLTLPNVYESQIKLRRGRLLPWGLFRLLWDLKIRRNIRTVRTITMGVVHEYQKRGIEAVFYIESFDRGRARGYRGGEFSWVLEDNDMMVKAALGLGAECYKRYRVYGMDL